MTVFQILALVFFGLAFVALVISIILFFNLEIIRVIGDLSGITAKKQIEQIRTQTTNISYGSHKRVQSNHNAAIDNMLVNSVSDSQAKAQAHESKNLNRRQKRGTAAAGITGSSGSFIPSPDGTESLDSMSSTGGLNSDLSGEKRRRRKKDLSEAATDVLNSDVTEMPTDVLSDSSEVVTDVLSDDVPTDILVDTSEMPTGVLNSEEDTQVDVTEMPTGVLNSGEKDIVDDVTEMPTGVLSTAEDEDAYEDSSEAATGLLSENYEVGTSVLSDDVGGTSVLSNEEVHDAISFTIVSDETVINTDEVID